MLNRSRLLLAALAGLTGRMQYAVASDTPAASRFALIPKDKDSDLKLYKDGRIVTGAQALSRMQAEAGLILWMAGNQFSAMDQVMERFQEEHPRIAVGLITLPAGLELDAIQAGGWHYGGVDYPGRPDLYSSVSLGHLQALKKQGLMDEYAIYMHNELQIMVARGNPMQVRSIADLGREGLRTSMPNPITEGIMQFYARGVLERHGLWHKISGGRECVSCQSTPTNWFTAVHHRETPARIKAGLSDAGIVWKTEALEALRDGAPVEGVMLPPDDSLRDKVVYAAGILKKSPHRQAAAHFLDFIASPDGQDAYAAVGFVKATPQELALKPIP